MTVYLFIFLTGLLAGCLSGIIGTGSSIVLLPILVFAFGPQQAVPIMAFAAVMGNIAKAASWWRDVEWRSFLAYSVPGVIGAALGARTLLILPPNSAEAALGFFFLAMIPGHHLMQARNLSIGLAGLAVAGLVIGFLSGIALSTGPISIPVFAAAGMMKGALISTEAAASLAIGLAKIATFRGFGALPLALILKGLAVGAAVMAGAFIGRQVLERMSDRAFRLALDAMLLFAGLAMLWAAFV